jgi:hypothetical protein
MCCKYLKTMDPNFSSLPAPVCPKQRYDATPSPCIQAEASCERSRCLDRAHFLTRSAKTFRENQWMRPRKEGLMQRLGSVLKAYNCLLLKAAPYRIFTQRRLNSNPILPYRNIIQFNSVQFSSIQFSSIQFNPVQSNSIETWRRAAAFTPSILTPVHSSL